ncbi:ComF family protein [Pantanalinema rosaneae CENA516]|uniref:ComF family protein n=1 Tax=Pantanalinema rosaneae TaxID=1620701 RepID=UPI003D6F614A
MSMKVWSQHWQRWLGVFLETTCPLCQRSTAQTVCPACQRQLEHCQLPASEQITHLEPWSLRILAWGSYQGSLKRAIAALKYDNHPELAGLLGQWLAQAWLTHTSPAKPHLTVVPIPLHADKQRSRGFNQAELLAEHFCDLTGLPLNRCGLVRSRSTEAQFQLSASDRSQNLTDAFSLGTAWLKHPPTGAVLLLDDIYTTGATARSAAQTLRRHGIRVSGIAALAKARSLHSGSVKPLGRSNL